MVVLHTRVQSAQPTRYGWEVVTGDGTRLPEPLCWLTVRELDAPLLAQRPEGFGCPACAQSFLRQRQLFFFDGRIGRFPT
jgi:hypothetical protein